MGDLISKNALLADIEECVVFSGRSGETSAEMRGAHKVVDRIKAAPTIEQPTWISVEDRLPIENGKYLVIREYSAWERSLRDISIEYYSTEFEGWFFDGIKLLGVTHWMPLPQPPKGVE